MPLRVARWKGEAATRRARQGIARRAGRARESRVLRGVWHTVPSSIRVRLRRTYDFRVFPDDVAVSRLLCGAQYGQSAVEFADRIRGLTWSSTRIRDSVYAQFLMEFGHAADPTNDELLDSSYGKFVLNCIGAYGAYFGVSDHQEVPQLLRDYLTHYQGGAPHPPRSGESPASTRVIVAPVMGSQFFQVLDGHHRAAIACARGDETIEAIIRREPVQTALQAYLSKMTWLKSTQAIYQPVGAPELTESWPLVRACTDRRDRMLTFLATAQILPAHDTTYLDLAACYGWFVWQMGLVGFKSHGVEIDPAAPCLANAIYGLPSGSLTTDDVVAFLQRSTRQWDVVSCFSLLHHFVMGNGTSSPEELLHLVDKVTRKVLFLDTGQEHEQWFRTSLAGWSTAGIIEFLRRETTFNSIIDLGPDHDSVGVYSEQYGRHLFACVRNTSVVLDSH